jgi:hypothetical protein
MVPKGYEKNKETWRPYHVVLRVGMEFASKFEKEASEFFFRRYRCLDSVPLR